MKLCIWALCVAGFVSGVLTQCTFLNKDAEASKEAQRRLKVIEGTLKRTSITEKGSGGYVYDIGVCKPAQLVPKQKDRHAGVTQMLADTKERPRTILGSLDSAYVVAGSNWLMLEYSNGDKCHEAVDGMENRTARIMFTCAHGVYEARSRVLERSEKTSCCFLFEIELDAACPPASGQKLSPGSVLCIILLVLVGIYLVGGALYQRVVVGAKGMEQIPNYSFWQDFGNLQADGCDFLCRSGGQTRGSREYHGIGDGEIHPPPNDGGQDDSLLPM